MVNEGEIRNRLAEALAQSQLAEFEDWFIQNTWNVHKSGDEDLIRLVYSIELRLAEHSSGHLSKAALRNELQEISSRQRSAV